MVNFQRLFCSALLLLIATQTFAQVISKHVPKLDTLKLKPRETIINLKSYTDSIVRSQISNNIKFEGKNLVEKQKSKTDTLIQRGLKIKGSIGDSVNDSVLVKRFKQNLKTAAKKSLNHSLVAVADSMLAKKKLSSKIPFTIESLAVLSGINYTNSAVTQPKNWVTNVGIEAEIKIYGTPVNLNVFNNFPNMANRNISGSNLFKLDYSSQEMLEGVIPGMSKFKEFASKNLKNIDYGQYARNLVVDQLRHTSLSKISQNGMFFNYINEKGNLENLLSKPKEKIRILVDSLLSLDSEKLLAKRINNSTGLLFIDSLIEDISLVEEKILGLKQDLADLGINPKNINEFQKFIEGKITPEKFLKEFQADKPLSKVPVLRHITNFSTGNFGTGVPGSFLNKELFVDGIDLGVQTGRGISRVGISTTFNQDFGPSNFSFPRLLGYVSIPLYQNFGHTAQLTWSGYSTKGILQNPSSGLNTKDIIPFNASSKAGSAFAVSQSFKNEKIGKLTFELSKSSTSFSNLYAINSPGMYIDRGTFGNYFRDDIFETMSFGVRYIADLEKTGLKTDLYFSYSGLGYQSPAQQSIANMGLRAGGTLRKSFYKNRLLLLVRGDLKNTPMASDASAYWQNQNFQIEAKVKLLKKLNISMRMLNNAVIKNTEVAALMFQTRKYQFDLTSSYRLGKLSNFSKLSFGNQSLTNPVNLMQTGFVTINYLQTLVFKNFSLNGNLLYNKEHSGVGLIGNILNGDVAAQYALSTKLNVSSGLTFLDNENIARQLGLKQSLNYNPSERLMISCYFDVRKDLIASTMPGLYANRNAEFSIKYIFIK